MIRDASAAAEDDARLIWLMLAFIRIRRVEFDRYRGIFNRSERTFKRDIAKLRELGQRYGFKLTPQRAKVVQLVDFEGRPRAQPVDDAGADVVRALSDAFGDIVAATLRGAVDVEGTSLDRFLRIGAPRLTEQSAVAETYRALREAWRANARVRFHYPARGRQTTVERVVEPHAATYHAGRYYLIGFDVRPRSGGWRQFALDRMRGPLVRAGTFRRRIIPEPYRGEDAVGIFKTGPKSEVTIELSAAIAEAVLARRWQRNERIARRPDRSATVTFEVHDLAEAVRWAFSFGAEARVIAPLAAVALARDVTTQMLRAYEPAESLRGAS
ncbi:MAG: WYL domain-containing protein [Candidatus Eremiobacteraeota bacterium]|nr:WYL domain-containing protein [Candidatus Eremiobacteraeota bacterium]